MEREKFSKSVLNFPLFARKWYDAAFSDFSLANNFYCVRTINYIVFIISVCPMVCALESFRDIF